MLFRKEKIGEKYTRCATLYRGRQSFVAVKGSSCRVGHDQPHHSQTSCEGMLYSFSTNPSKSQKQLHCNVLSKKVADSDEEHYLPTTWWQEVLYPSIRKQTYIWGHKRSIFLSAKMFIIPLFLVSSRLQRQCKKAVSLVYRKAALKKKSPNFPSLLCSSFSTLLKKKKRKKSIYPKMSHNYSAITAKGPYRHK